MRQNDSRRYAREYTRARAGLQMEREVLKEITLVGRLAQLVEHCDHTAGVTGSSPVAPTTCRSIHTQQLDEWMCSVPTASGTSLSTRDRIRKPIAGDDDGHVISTATLQGEFDERAAILLGSSISLEHARNQIVRDHFGQAVRA